jgi:hypothetical protein
VQNLLQASPCKKNIEFLLGYSIIVNKKNILKIKYMVLQRKKIIGEFRGSLANFKAIDVPVL